MLYVLFYFIGAAFLLYAIHLHDQSMGEYWDKEIWCRAIAFVTLWPSLPIVIIESVLFKKVREDRADPVTAIPIVWLGDLLHKLVGGK
jgi:hypothetical protein